MAQHDVELVAEERLVRQKECDIDQHDAGRGDEFRRSGRDPHEQRLEAEPARDGVKDRRLLRPHEIGDPDDERIERNPETARPRADRRPHGHRGVDGEPRQHQQKRQRQRETGPAREPGADARQPAGGVRHRVEHEPDEDRRGRRRQQIPPQMKNERRKKHAPEHEERSQERATGARRRDAFRAGALCVPGHSDGAPIDIRPPRTSRVGRTRPSSRSRHLRRSAGPR